MCLVVIISNGYVEERKIPIVRVGRRRRAVTFEELEQLLAKRQQRQLQEDLEYSSHTMVGGSSNHVQRITRCSYGEGPEWCHKDRHHRAMARDGDRSLRDKYRTRTRRTALVD